jgi:hypothetical protein
LEEELTMPVAVPLAVAAASAAASAYGAHKQSKQAEKAAKSQADLNNKYLTDRQAGVQDLLARLGAGGIDPFSKQRLESGGSSYEKSNPFITEEYKGLDDMVRGVLSNRLSRGSSLPPGYEANAIRAVNEASRGASTAAQNVAARHGLSGQQAFAMASPAESARAGKIADIRGNTPLLERQMMNEDIGIEGDRQKAFGTGSESRRTWNGWQESLPDIGGLASLLLPPGAQQSTVSPYSAGGSLFGALGQGGMAAASMLAANQSGNSQPQAAGNPSNVAAGGAWSNPWLQPQPYNFSAPVLR